MPIFPTAAKLRGIMAPIVADSAAQLGSRATIVRKATTHAADRSARVTWPVAHTDVAIRISTVTTDRLQTVWGVNSQVSTDGTCADTVDLKDGDGIIVTSGNYAGEQFSVTTTKRNALAGALYAALDAPTEPFV